MNYVYIYLLSIYRTPLSICSKQPDYCVLPDYYRK